MYALEDIRHVHIEPTTRCNAACPMCARNVRGVTAPGLQLTELSLEDVRAMLPPDFLAQLTGFDLCGAYGDPALTSDLIEIVAYIRSVNPECTITAFTNGGVRSAQWWRRLARELGSPARIVFAIDGIGDTNGVYRRGVDFEKVMTNAAAFIAAGGDARWDFLAFRHNEHQVDAARARSEQMGFTTFSVKRTDRFLEPSYDYVPELEGQADRSRFPVYGPDGTIVDYLAQPEDPTLVNATALHRNDLLGHYGSLDDLFDRTPIRCRVLDTASVFISSGGHAFPCCWTYVQATRPGMSRFPAGRNRQVVELVEATGGLDQVDVRTRGLRSVIESRLFTAIEASWSCSSVAEGRLKVCARACGEDFPAYFDQFDRPELLPRSLRPTGA